MLSRHVGMRQQHFAYAPRLALRAPMFSLLLGRERIKPRAGFLDKPIKFRTITHFNVSRFNASPMMSRTIGNSVSSSSSIVSSANARNGIFNNLLSGSGRIM